MDPFIVAVQAIQVDPNQSVNIIRALVIGLLGLGFLVAGVAAVFGPGRKGNTRRSWDIASASLVALVPAVIGAGGIALALGMAVFGWVIPGING